MREDDIRPDVLMKEFFTHYDADAAWLAARRETFVRTPCPACGEEAKALTYEKEGLHWVRCSGCGTVYVSPRPTQEVLAEFYARSASYRFQNEVLFPASEAARRKNIFQPRAEMLDALCERYGVEKGTRLVEVGPGFGLFLEEAAKLHRFSRIMAVEATPALAKTCQKRGFEVLETSVEQADLGEEKADVVASFECLEHLFSPWEFLTGCFRLLRPGGLLVVTCPNGEGFDIVTLGERSNTVNHQHLNLFNTRSFPLLAEACGFEVVEVSTPGRLDAEIVRKAALTGRLDLSHQPFLQRVLVDDWEALGKGFQEYLVRAGLSSHMQLVARRPENGGKRK